MDVYNEIDVHQKILLVFKTGYVYQIFLHSGASYLDSMITCILSDLDPL
jgi:hypothetical protein